MPFYVGDRLVTAIYVGPYLVWQAGPLSAPSYDGGLSDGFTVTRDTEIQSIATAQYFSGGSLQYSATGLPAGLSISQATGEITGTPTADGTSSVTVTAENSIDAATATFSITVESVALWLASPSAETYSVGTGTRFANMKGKGYLPDDPNVETAIFARVISVEILDFGSGIYGCKSFVAGEPAPTTTRVWRLNGSPISGQTGDTIDMSGQSGSLTVVVTTTNTHPVFGVKTHSLTSAATTVGA